MKRLLALVAGGLGLRAFLKRRSRTSLGPSPADDLRTKLAEAKATVEAQIEDADSGETTIDEAADPPSAGADEQGVDERRADVHAKARQAMQDLGDS